MARGASLLLLLTAAAAAVSGTFVAAPPAVALPRQAPDMQDGCVHFQIIHSTNTKHFSKRAVELSLANRSDVAYYAKLDFGTPAQSQFVQLDTGSFELWINPSCDGLSSGDTAFCNSIGTFDPSASSTFSSLGVGKQLRYGIGSANITYVRDSIALPGTSSVLEQVQFGVATSSVDEFSGILGIGFGMGLTTRYPNFVDELALQNVTRVKAFSLALGGKAEQEGVIVFGGVDTSKFTGALERLPITPAAQAPDGVPRYWVSMASVSLSPPGRAATSRVYANSNMQVFLDSGSTLSLLPTALADSIAADFGAPAAAADGFYTVDCSLASSTGGTLDFAFGATTISVPYSELIRRSGSRCMLGIQASSDFVLLGDTFLRSAYVVIDQSQNNVWMAPYVNCGSTPAALASAASLATLTGLCSASTSNDASSSTPSSSSSASTASASSTRAATTVSPASSSTSTSNSSPQSQSSSSSSSSSTSGASASTALSGAPRGLLYIAAAAAAALLTPWL